MMQPRCLTQTPTFTLTHTLPLNLTQALTLQRTMREHGLIGRLPCRSDGGQQAALEPAAVLVAALQIQVCRDAGLPQHRRPAGARVEPHILRGQSMGCMLGTNILHRSSQWT